MKKAEVHMNWLIYLRIRIVEETLSVRWIIPMDVKSPGPGPAWSPTRRPKMKQKKCY